MRLVQREIFIDAPPSRVYELLTRADLLVEWMAPIARVDAWPGGQVSWTHAAGDTMSGQFLELVPDRRVVFSFGWERPDIEIPPGSSTVEVDLRPHLGGTQVRLTHRGLEGPMSDAHSGGWANYLPRLAARAEDRDPGVDPLIAERVPAADQLSLP